MKKIYEILLKPVKAVFPKLDELTESLMKEFPEIEQSTMVAILYLIFYDEKGNIQNRDEACRDLLSDEEPSSFSEEKKMEVLYELLLQIGKNICRKKEIVETAKKLLEKTEQSIRQKQKRRAPAVCQSRKRPAEDESSPGAKC